MSSWDAAEKWYSDCVGNKGHYYHQSVVLPNALRMLNLTKQKSLIDLGCGQGVLARHLPDSIEYTGVDLSKKLIDEAKRTTKRKNCSFHVADATAQKLPLGKTDFDRASCILALQNMEHGEGAIQSAARHLREEGELLLVLNHPAFRIPRQSGWGVDEKASLQYRRMNGYMSPMNIPLQINPGKGEKSEIFYSYHQPLSNYISWLSKAGFLIHALEEWISDKKSEGAKARMEDRARREIPLFLALGAILFKKAATV
jgi:ubiquinone/menaquinone biosynthesis C-methylase UbiE